VLTLNNEQEKLMLEHIKELTSVVTKLASGLNEAQADIAAHKAIINTLLKRQPNLEDIADDFSNSISIVSYQTKDQDHLILEKSRKLLEMMKLEISVRKRHQGDQQ